MTDKLDKLEHQDREMNLRSKNSLNLMIPRTRTKQGEKAFIVTAPTIWNKLPQQLKETKTIESFKSNYKMEILGISKKNQLRGRDEK